MTMPLGKRRFLPDWMLGAGGRVGIGSQKVVKSKPTPVSKPATHKSLPVKSTPKAKRMYHEFIYL
jgi:hypothetical protein